MVCRGTATDKEVVEEAEEEEYDKVEGKGALMLARGFFFLEL
jgi:hypothetical protein